MDEIKAVLNNAIALVKDPVGYMTQNKGQTVPVNSLMINYVAVLALVPLVGRIIGDLLFYGGAGVGYSIAGAIVSYILDIVSVFVIGIVIWKLAPSFNTIDESEQGDNPSSLRVHAGLPGRDTEHRARPRLSGVLGVALRPVHPLPRASHIAEHPRRQDRDLRGRGARCLDHHPRHHIPDNRWTRRGRAQVRNPQLHGET